MSELKPCPFCGGKAEVQNKEPDWDKDKWYRIICTKCPISTFEITTLSELVKAWNKRI